jgi:hypothetical protein
MAIASSLYSTVPLPGTSLASVDVSLTKLTAEENGQTHTVFIELLLILISDTFYVQTDTLAMAYLLATVYLFYNFIDFIIAELQRENIFLTLNLFLSIKTD